MENLLIEVQKIPLYRLSDNLYIIHGPDKDSFSKKEIARVVYFKLLNLNNIDQARIYLDYILAIEAKVYNLIESNDPLSILNFIEKLLEVSSECFKYALKSDRFYLFNKGFEILLKTHLITLESSFNSLLNNYNSLDKYSANIIKTTLEAERIIYLIEKYNNSDTWITEDATQTILLENNIKANSRATLLKLVKEGKILKKKLENNQIRYSFNSIQKFISETIKNN